MMTKDRLPLTELLRRWAAGDRDAVETLTPLIYGELRRIAGARLREERSGHTLQPTELVHEAFLRLMHEEGRTFQSRSHFFAFASHVMRQILIDYARKFNAAKRGGAKVTFDESILGLPARAGNLLVLDEALDELARVDQRKASAVEMRYFGGMTGEEIAESLGIGTATVTRELRTAQAWLTTYVNGHAGEAGL